MFNDYCPDKQREIISNLMETVNDTIMFCCRITGSSNMKFLVGMNTIATKMFLLLYDPQINHKLEDCRGTLIQPICVNREFLGLVNEYNVLLLDYNNFLTMHRQHTCAHDTTHAKIAPTIGGSKPELVRIARPVGRGTDSTAQPVEFDEDTDDDDDFGGFDDIPRPDVANGELRITRNDP